MEAVSGFCYDSGMKKRRTRLRLDRLLLVAFGLVAMLTLAILGIRALLPAPAATPAPETETQNEPADPTVHVTATGDILLEEPLLNTFGNGDWQNYLADLDPLLAQDDLTIANMEVPIGGEELGITGIDYSFNSPAQTAANLKDHSIEFVSLANNHAMDRDVQGIINTHANLDAAGVQYTGTFLSQEERDQTRILTVKDMTIAIVSWTYETNQPADADWRVNSFHSAWDERVQTLLADLARAREQADAVIVCMHWGTEFTYELNEDQQVLGPQIAAAGADVIIGNHPHTIQPAQWIEADGRRTLCFWSLGNFMASAYQVSRADETFQNMYEVGAIATFDLVPGQDGVTVSSPEIIPIVNHFEGEYENFRLMRLKDYTEKLASRHSQRQYSDLFTRQGLVEQVHGVFDGSGFPLQLD